MKYSNVKFTAQITSKPPYKVRSFATEQALSNWANSEYRKDNTVQITVYKGFGRTEKDIYCTYSA